MVGNHGIHAHSFGANGSGPRGRDRSADPSIPAVQEEVDLRDKVALIVDGPTADGEALALALARRGMHIIFLFFHEEHVPAAAVKEQVEAQERQCLLISWQELRDSAGDGTGEKRTAEQAMHLIAKSFDRLDVFINLSPQPHRVNGDHFPQAEKPALRSRLLPHLNIMTAALNQMTQSDPDG